MDKLAKSFSESEKRRNKYSLDLEESRIKRTKENLNGEYYKPSEPRKKELQKELLEQSQDFSISEAAYKKKWFSQREDETIASRQILRRQ